MAKPVCTKCGKPMKLLDEENQKWYCYKDDEVFYGKENRWGEGGAKELSWNCVECGAPLRGTFFQHDPAEPQNSPFVLTVTCKTCLEQYTLPRVENLQQEASLPRVRLRYDKGNKITYPGRIGQVNEVAEKIAGGIGGALGGGLVGGIGGGVLGLSIGLSPGSAHTKLGKKDQDKIRKRIEKDPYRYPFSDAKVNMFCLKCDMKVRADQEKCEHCGERIAIPSCYPYPPFVLSPSWTKNSE